MTRTLIAGASLVALTLLGGCDGLTPFNAGPNTVIATSADRGVDQGVLRTGEAAVAYDPDGCQAWVIDDGVEGYASRRFDPVSGLPICNSQFPPGAVVGEHRTAKSGIADFTPGSSRGGTN